MVFDSDNLPEMAQRTLIWDHRDENPKRIRIASLHDLAGRFPQKMEVVDVGKMSSDEVTAIQYENLRRQQANDIFNVLQHHQSELEKWQDSQRSRGIEMPNDPKTQSTPSQDVVNIPYYRPKKLTAQRYDEIKQYLIDNCEDLAIDLMDPELELTENVFRKYILKQGNFDLEVDEWRAFLISCQEEHQTLFR